MFGEDIPPENFTVFFYGRYSIHSREITFFKQYPNFPLVLSDISPIFGDMSYPHEASKISGSSSLLHLAPPKQVPRSRRYSKVLGLRNGGRSQWSSETWPMKMSSF